MKELDLKSYFGFGGYTAEEEAYGVEFSEELYQRLKEIYQDSGETNLESILEDEELNNELKNELSKLIDVQKEELIEVQHDNGDDYDPDTGEEYDFSGLQIEIEVVVPEEWEV